MITFDPNLRLPLWKTKEAARQEILWGLSRADVVKISDEETQFLWGGISPEEAGRLISECRVKLAMVTLGPKGCYLSNGHASAGASCPKVRPIDTTGAGDIFREKRGGQLLRTGKRPEELSEEELYRIAAFMYGCQPLHRKTGRNPGIPSEMRWKLSHESVTMLKVIIADDERLICRLVQALGELEALDMEVAGLAENGLEALELIERRGRISDHRHQDAGLRRPGAYQAGEGASPGAGRL